MAKSADAFRTIREVSEWLDTPAHVLRFWESKFSQIKPVKRAGGRRYYRPSDMLLIGGIKKLLHEDGMTIKGVRKLIHTEGVKFVSKQSQPLDLGPADDEDAVLEHVPAQTSAPITDNGDEGDIAAALTPALPPEMPSDQKQQAQDIGTTQSGNPETVPPVAHQEPLSPHVVAEADGGPDIQTTETMVDQQPAAPSIPAISVPPDPEDNAEIGNRDSLLSELLNRSRGQLERHHASIRPLYEKLCTLQARWASSDQI